MLVLTRKQRESIWIGDDVELTITKIHSNRVQIGINAPENVVIRRSELPPRAEWITATLPAIPPPEPNQPIVTAIA